MDVSQASDIDAGLTEPTIASLQKRNAELEQELQQYRTELHQLRSSQQATTNQLSHLLQLQQYERIVSVTPDAIGLIDHTYTYRVVNHTYSKWYQQPVHEIIGRTVCDLMGATLFETTVKPNLDRCLAGELVRFESWFHYPDGNRRFVGVTYTPYIEQDGRITGVVVNKRDLTNLKQAEAALAESEGFLRNIYEHTQVSIFLVDVADGPVFRYVSMNPTHQRITGLASIDIRDKTPEQIFPSAIAAQIRRNYCTCVERGESITYEEMVPFLGQEFWWLTTLTPLFDNQNRVYRLLGSCLDITERKRTENALRQQAEREQAVNRVMQAIRHSLDLEEIVNTATAELGHLLLTDRVSLWRYWPDQELWMVLAEYRCCPTVAQAVGLEIPDRNNPFAARLKQGKIVQIEDTASIEDAVNQAIAQVHPGAWLIVPLQVNGVCWGAITLYASLPRQWQAAEVQLTRMVTDQLAIAIQQANLFQQVQQLNQHLEARVQERTHQLQLALTAAHMGTWEWDLRTNQKNWSPEACTLFDFHPTTQLPTLEGDAGYSPQVPDHDFLLSRIHPEDVPIFQRACELALQENGFYECEFRVVWQDGSIHWIYERGAYTYDSHGQPIKLGGICMDITERKQIEAALRQSETRYRGMIQMQNEIVCRALPDTTITFVNEAVRRIGVTPQDLIGTRWLETVHPDDYETVWQKITQLTPANPTLSSEHRHVSADGATYWFQWSMHGIFDDQGNLMELQTVGRDVSEEVRLETERKLAEEKIRQSLLEKEVMLKEIHHRVKNNLQIIVSLLRMQAQQHQDTQITTLFQEAQNRVRSMALIHEQLYQSSDLAGISFSAYLKILVDNLYKSYGVSQSLITPVIEADLVTLPIHVAIPCGLIANELISNALKYAFPEQRAGKISIQLRAVCGNNPLQETDCTHVKLIVADDGIGLPDHLNLDTLDTLGLTLVHSLTQQIGGNLVLRREGGTWFEIIFPCCKEYISPKVPQGNVSSG